MGELMKGQKHWVFPSHPPKEKHIYQHKFDYICKVPFSIQGNSRRAGRGLWAAGVDITILPPTSKK